MNKKEAEAEGIALDARWRKVCSETLTLVTRNRDAWIFKEPVIESPELSHEAKVAYTNAIPEPMDFRTVRRNIGAFADPTEFERDMLLVFRNCSTFNKPGQDAFEMGRDVENVFLARWELERRKEIAHSLFLRSIELAGNAVLESTRRKSLLKPPFYDTANRKVVEFNLHSTSSGGSSGSHSPHSWKEIVTNLYNQIVGDPQMAWFLRPVHSYPEIPVLVKKNYYALIKSPMDLATVGKNLSLYPSAGEFRKDVELIVTNSLRFNPPQSPVNLAALELQRIISGAFDDTFKAELGAVRNNDWNGIKKQIPDPPGEDLVEPPPPTVLRLKRSRTAGDEVPPAPVPQASVEPPVVTTTTVSAVEKKGVSVPNVLLINRPMVPLDKAVDWRGFAQHCLTELNQIKDESSNNRLTWIFQRPLFKYELPVSIKRLYLLSITELVDLSMITERLNPGGVYDRGNGPSDFEADVIRMLDNCLVFNDESQFPHKVGFVLKKHFNLYWIDGGLRERAVQAWKEKGKEHAVLPASSSYEHALPNWEEIRQQVMPDVVRPNQDCDSVSGSFPLNEELLYEWRVSQRFVMQQLRNELVSKN